MNIAGKLLLFLSIYCFSLSVHGQQKFAVLVGINEYYQAAGVKSPSSLKGCVNDVKSIKGLLENRFGFNPRDIYTLYNAAATKKNMIDQLRMVFHKSKPGDAVVFYFSGHGVWITNHNLDKDTVKRGMSQAIVMSDLYSPGWDCLVRDETLKDIFNQFVDKKIILTSIFDCCYSGNLMMNPGPAEYWDGWLHNSRADKKDIYIESIPFAGIINQPAGCRVDAAGKIIDTLDSDLDGVPDCKDWELHTEGITSVDSLGVGQDPVDLQAFLSWPDNYYDSSRFANDRYDGDTATVSRSFNLKDALFASNKSSVRPSDRKGSRFLTLSASADNMKALEITGISGNKQGAFTEALLSVYSKNPPGMPVAELKKKITALMRQQNYRQGPMYHYDSSRLKGNLVGITSSGFFNRTHAKCIASKNGMITLDKGEYAGINKGNTLTALAGGRTTIQVLQVWDDSATAVTKTGGQVKPGQVFEVTDPYTISSPLIKVYIPSVLFTPAGYESFFNQKILPLTNREGYTDYYFKEETIFNGVIIWDDETKFRTIEDDWASRLQGYSFSVLLPVPSYIATFLRNNFGKDQNIELVTDPAKADLVLYLNYVKKRPGVKSGFVFYFHPPVKIEYSQGRELFSKKHVQFPSMRISSSSLDLLNRQLQGFVREYTRKKTTTWINGDLRR